MDTEKRKKLRKIFSFTKMDMIIFRELTLCGLAGFSIKQAFSGGGSGVRWAGGEITPIKGIAGA